MGIQLSTQYLSFVLLLLLALEFVSIGKCQRRGSLLRWEPFYAADSSPLGNLPVEHVCGPEHTPNWFIYCQGPLLEAVNYHRLYPDSKDFVDSPLKMSPDQTLANFKEEFGNLTLSNIEKNKLKVFVENHFDAPGTELLDCVPEDWGPHPTSLESIKDQRLRHWALQLNGIWKRLCKRMNPEIANHSGQHSLIYVPNEFIIPGGRFREFYYWDAYWIVRGLMASQMERTAKKMIQNLAHVVERYGMVPNGGRVYYLSRSQPPLLAPMLFHYFINTRDLAFVNSTLPILEKEVEYWERKRNIIVSVADGRGAEKEYKFYQYKADSNVPRPESFKEDMNKTEGMDQEQMAFFFKSIASAAEAGWDFSSRWLRNATELASIETVNIVPVDLNAIMCWNFAILGKLHSALGNEEKARYFRKRRSKMREMIDKLLYNETMGVWSDYNLRTKRHTTAFYASVAMPLFTKCYDQMDESYALRLFDFMKTNGALDFPGGIPMSVVRGTGEQWDLPNGWSPLNHIVAEGLRMSQSAEMQEQGYQLARKWVLANLRVFRSTKQMWEKYNVVEESFRPGQGGEYEVQDGFGWTNGVILDWLVAFHDRMDSPVDINPQPAAKASAFSAALSLHGIIMLIATVSLQTHFLWM